LQVTDIVEVREGGFGVVPAGIERQYVPLEHAPEKADGGRLVHEDDPAFAVAVGHLKAEFFVERAGGGEVLDGETDREIAELHGGSSYGAGSWGNQGLRGHCCGTCATARGAEETDE
jgi:hypothetical protein